MENTILGLHHITAIAGNAKRNYDFYTKTLGQRLVKKTVNFDDPHTYHFYYGDKTGTPGSILTFFPWENIQSGRRGTRQATEIGYSVPRNSLGFWTNRLKDNQVTYDKVSEKFGEQYLGFRDPDGLKIELIASEQNDLRLPWETDAISAENATRGFHSVTVTTNKLEPTAAVLTHLFDYRLLATEGNRHRFITDTVENANILDLLEVPGGTIGHIAGGSVHHVAFRVKDDKVLMEIRNKIVEAGLHITEKIDRNYFYSLYFREPGGVLFEIATDNPGFSVDESVEDLGKGLKLPPQYEKRRNEIASILPQL